MKKLFSILCSLLIISSVAFSQPSNGSVTINVTGNRTKQVAVDNKYYTISNTASTAEQAIVINDLASGQHVLELVRTNQYNKSTSTKSSFTLREGYDLVIDVNSNGAISLSETRVSNNWRGGAKGINTTTYNKLYAAAKKKTSSASRSTFLEKEFITSKRYTSKQASTLIQLVNSESLRLKLAKQVYPKITDQQNFSLVSSLLNSTANRNDLNNYIATLPVDDDLDDNMNASTPMTNQKFQVIYDEVTAESSAADKSYYLSNFFNKDFNYYTSAQASQLIQLITTDAERLKLAKIAYRGVTDKGNYGLVSQLISNSSYRADLTAYINGTNNNTGNTDVNPVMSMNDFNKIYQSAYYQNTASGRYTIINNAFNTSGSYFSVAQAKQLIQLVNVESSRLLLSKAAYKVLVDRANYTSSMIS